MRAWPVLAFMTVVACQTPEPEKGEVLSLEERLSEPRVATWQIRRERILAEDSATDATWAGSYSEGDGFTGTSVTVAPDAGFAFSRFGCMGAYDRNLGSVEQEGGVLVLRPEWQVPLGESLGVPARLIVVPWGERTYLLEERELIEFCNWVNSGFEPRGGWWGQFLMETDSFDEEPSGLPDLPEPYQRFILDLPVEARIVSVGTWTTLDDSDDWIRAAPVTVDVGANDGVFKGMWLFDEHCICDVWIEEVGLESSSGRIEVFGEALETEAGVGTRLSTSSGVEYSWMVEDQ